MKEKNMKLSLVIVNNECEGSIKILENKLKTK